MKIFDDDKAKPAMELIMTLETKVRDLREENKSLKQAALYAITHARALALGLGCMIGGLVGVPIGFLARNWISGVCK